MVNAFQAMIQYKPFRCLYCRRYFHSIDRLKQHNQRHATKYDSIRDKCDSLCYNPANYTHTRNKPYQYHSESRENEGDGSTDLFAACDTQHQPADKEKESNREEIADDKKYDICYICEKKVLLKNIGGHLKNRHKLVGKVYYETLQTQKTRRKQREGKIPQIICPLCNQKLYTKRLDLHLRSGVHGLKHQPADKDKESKREDIDDDKKYDICYICEKKVLLKNIGCHLKNGHKLIGKVYYQTLQTQKTRRKQREGKIPQIMCPLCNQKLYTKRLDLHLRSGVHGLKITDKAYKELISGKRHKHIQKKARKEVTPGKCAIHKTVMETLHKYLLTIGKDRKQAQSVLAVTRTVAGAVSTLLGKKTSSVRWLLEASNCDIGRGLHAPPTMKFYCSQLTHLFSCLAIEQKIPRLAVNYKRLTQLKEYMRVRMRRHTRGCAQRTSMTKRQTSDITEKSKT